MAYVATTPMGGIVDLSQVVIAANVGTPWVGSTNNLPSMTPEQQLGQVVTAYDTAANANATGAGGAGEFIFLAIPASTAVTAGLLYSYTPSDYKIVIVPSSVSSQAVSGFPIALAVITVASNAAVQYAWFQVGGRGTVLKTAVAVSPNVAVYVSATAGRIKVLGSAFRAIIGARTANAASVTSTTSTVAIYLNGRPCITAGI